MTVSESTAGTPSFDFSVPKAYAWLLERRLVGFMPFSALQPWHYLDSESVIDVTARWPGRSNARGRLVAFARRQDCDDLACFEIQGGQVTGVALVNAWTPEGYAIVERYEDMWCWLAAAVQDIAQWVQLDGMRP